jgi:hypothetical protein
MVISFFVSNLIFASPSGAIASTIALLKQLREQGITETELNTAKRSITKNKVSNARLFA